MLLHTLINTSFFALLILFVVQYTPFFDPIKISVLVLLDKSGRAGTLGKFVAGALLSATLLCLPADESNATDHQPFQKVQIKFWTVYFLCHFKSYGPCLCLFSDAATGCLVTCASRRTISLWRAAIATVQVASIARWTSQTSYSTIARFEGFHGYM
jgi:hypothetical protein